MDQPNNQKNDSSLAIKLTGDESWASIVDAIVSEMPEDELPDKVVQATELLLSGLPMHDVAKKLRVKTQTVRRWLTMYPTMSAAISMGRDLLTKWRMAKLEEQFVLAAEKSKEVLELGLDGFDKDGNRVDPKVLTVIAAQSRYVMGLFAGQKVDVTVKHELGDTVLKAKADALDYLAQQLKQQNDNADVEPVEAVFRVIDPKLDNNGPMLDENGQPFHGELAKIDVTEDGGLCHVCGERRKALDTHILNRHGMTAGEYEIIFMLEPGTLADIEKREVNE